MDKTAKLNGTILNILETTYFENKRLLKCTENAPKMHFCVGLAIRGATIRIRRFERYGRRMQ